MANLQRRARKTGGSSYRVQVRFKGQSLTKTFATRAQARQWATQVESGIQRQHAPNPAANITLGELLERYRHDVLPHKRLRTQANQAQHLDWWTQALGPRPMDGRRDAGAIRGVP
jgi:hypothetical protein